MVGVEVSYEDAIGVGVEIVEEVVDSFTSSRAIEIVYCDWW
jgi:hypothetical protein